MIGPWLGVWKQVVHILYYLGKYYLLFYYLVVLLPTSLAVLARGGKGVRSAVDKSWKRVSCPLQLLLQAS